MNKEIVILKDEKGNVNVLMNACDYEAKLLDIVYASSYKPLPKINKIYTMVSNSIKPSSIGDLINKGYACLTNSYNCMPIYIMIKFNSIKNA